MHISGVPMRVDAGASESCILGLTAQCEGLYSHILVQHSPPTGVCYRWVEHHASTTCLKGSIILDPRKIQKDKEETRVGWPSCSASLYFPLLYAAPATPHCDLNKMIFKVSLTRMCPWARSCPFSLTDRQGCLDARRLVRRTRHQRVRHLKLKDCRARWCDAESVPDPRCVPHVSHPLFRKTREEQSPPSPSGWMRARRSPPPAVVAPLPREGSSRGAALAQRARRKRTDNLNFCLDP